MTKRLVRARPLRALWLTAVSMSVPSAWLGCDAMQPAPLPSYADDEAGEDEEDETDDDATADMRDAGKVDAGKKDDAGKGDAGAKDAGKDAGRDAGKASSALYCKAQAVLDQHCTACHDGEGTAGAPMGLRNFEELTAPNPSDEEKKVWEVVGERVHDRENPMPPKGLLRSSQLKDLESWLAAGAPEGSDC